MNFIWKNQNRHFDHRKTQLLYKINNSLNHWDLNNSSKMITRSVYANKLICLNSISIWSKQLNQLNEKKDVKIKKKIQKQLKNIHSKMYKVIKYVIDTNISNKILLLKEKKKSEEISKLSIIDEQQTKIFSTSFYFFENMIIKNKSNSLYYNVIYDSKCDFFFIHKKFCFIDNIISISIDQWYNILDNEMLVIDYKIMKIINRDDYDQFVKLLFKNIV